MATFEEDLSLKDKTVLILGCEGIPSNTVLDMLNRYGLKVVVVDSSDAHYAAAISKFIQYDCKDGKQVQKHAKNIVQRLNELKLTFDGCVSFVDLYVPLAAEICHKLGLPGLSLKAALASSMKSQTHKLLRTKKLEYAGKVFLVDPIEEITLAIKTVGLPAVMKTERCSSIGSRIVKDEATAVSLYKQIREGEADCFLAYGRTIKDRNFVLMEYFGGTEHGVDIIIFEGRLIAAFVHDKGGPNKEDFKLSTKLMPSILDKFQIDQLTEAAYQCCISVGLKSGVFNLDIKLTALGPRLIEINPRMGGNIIPEMIQECYNVDILKCCMLTTLGVRPNIAKMDAKCYVAGIMCHESLHGRRLKDETTKTVMERYLKNGLIQCLNLQLPSDKTQNKHHQCPISAIFVKGNSHQEAVIRLNGVCDALDLAKNQNDFNYYLAKI